MNELSNIMNELSNIIKTLESQETPKIKISKESVNKIAEEIKNNKEYQRIIKDLEKSMECLLA